MTVADDKIIDLYIQRNELATTESNKKYGTYCYTVANNILNNNEDSDECINDTWYRAWNAIPPAHPSCLKLFFAKITRNLALDKLKARSAAKRGSDEISHVLDELGECIADTSDVETLILTKELTKIINSFLRTLSEHDCNVFVRRYFFAETITDIAKRYNQSTNNITVNLSRTRKKLKTYLEKEGYII